MLILAPNKIFTLAAKLGREYMLIDNNPEAVQVMTKRLASTRPELIGFENLGDIEFGGQGSLF